MIPIAAKSSTFLMGAGQENERLQTVDCNCLPWYYRVGGMAHYECCNLLCNYLGMYAIP